MIRTLLFTVALWGTARLAAVLPAALRLCRRLAPAEVRHLVDRVATDDELVDVCGWAVTLQQQIDAAAATRNDAMRTVEEADAFTRRVIEPLRSRHRLLVERANGLTARTLRGHQARARMAAARHAVVEDASEAGWAVAPCIRALVRDLAA